MIQNNLIHNKKKSNYSNLLLGLALGSNNEN